MSQWVRRDHSDLQRVVVVGTIEFQEPGDAEAFLRAVLRGP
jgi:hypothetical protein